MNRIIIVRAAAVLKDEALMLGQGALAMASAVAFVVALAAGALTLELWFWDWYCGGEICGLLYVRP